MYIPLLGVQVLRRIVENGVAHSNMVDLAFKEEEEALLDVIPAPASKT